MANFVIVQYGIADGAQDIHPKCNDALVGLQPGCEIIYKARGTAFATMNILLMIHGLTVSLHSLLGDVVLMIFLFLSARA